jgi:hypothetical protein
VLVAVTLVSVAAIGGVWDTVQDLHRHEHQQIRDACASDNEVRAAVVHVLHRWAALGIPPTDHAIAVGVFLAEIDAEFAPHPCPS